MFLIVAVENFWSLSAATATKLSMVQIAINIIAGRQKRIVSPLS
jgi:hypothetical protein